MTKTSEVIQAWKNGHSLKTETVSSLYGTLKSYQMVIGKNMYGVTVLLEPSQVHVSQTTSKHLNKARAYADMFVSPVNGQFPDNDTLLSDVSFLQGLQARVNPTEYSSAYRGIERRLNELGSIGLGQAPSLNPPKPLYPKTFADLDESWIISFSDIVFKYVVRVTGIYVHKKRGIAYKTNSEGRIESVYVGTMDKYLTINTRIEKVK